MLNDREIVFSHSYIYARSPSSCSDDNVTKVRSFIDFIVNLCRRERGADLHLFDVEKK
jgi:hypothetical protein